MTCKNFIKSKAFQDTIGCCFWISVLILIFFGFYKLEKNSKIQQQKQLQKTQEIEKEFQEKIKHLQENHEKCSFNSIYKINEQESRIIFNDGTYITIIADGYYKGVHSKLLFR